MKKHRPLTLFAFLFALLLLGSSLSSCLYAPAGSEEEEERTEKGQIFFENRRFTYTGDADCVSYTDDTLVIKQAGAYRLSGELTEGRVVADCYDGGTVRLILDGVKLHSSYGAVVSSRGGTALIVEAVADTVNFLSTSAYAEPESLFPTACLFAEGSLLFCGDGRLVVDTDSECALLSLCELSVVGSSLTLNAADCGIWVRDRFLLDGGRVTVSFANIGIFAHDGEYSRGEVEIRRGSLVALCEETAIRAGRSIEITGGLGSIDAPIVYICERRQEGTTVAGSVKVTSPDFPEYKAQTKKAE